MLGAAIITRNAETTISNALDSLKGVVQQIVVVDTGSTDATPQICTRYGAELHFFKWRDDFSAARNYALQFMRTDWILQIDSDEILDGDSLLKNIELFKNGNLGGIQTEIHNLLKDNSVQKHIYTRLFINHPQVRYSGRIHEQIADSIRNAGFEIANSDITIHHFGYAQTNPEKLQRNSDLLLKDLRDDPNDVFKKYHLALTHFAAQDFASAENLLKEIYTSEFLSGEQQETALLKLSQIALSREDFDNIFQFTEFISPDTDREGLRLFIISTALLLQRNFDEALKILHSPLVKNSRLVDQQQVSAVILHFARYSLGKSF